jgi:hypothetical protein
MPYRLAQTYRRFRGPYGLFKDTREAKKVNERKMMPCLQVK